jgi:hypothetical protein
VQHIVVDASILITGKKKPPKNECIKGEIQGRIRVVRARCIRRIDCRRSNSQARRRVESSAVIEGLFL